MRPDFSVGQAVERVRTAFVCDMFTERVHVLSVLSAKSSYLRRKRRRQWGRITCERARRQRHRQRPRALLDRTRCRTDYWDNEKRRPTGGLEVKQANLGWLEPSSGLRMLFREDMSLTVSDIARYLWVQNSPLTDPEEESRCTLRIDPTACLFF